MLKDHCLEFLPLLQAFRDLLSRVREEAAHRQWPKNGHPPQGFLADAILMIDQKIERLTKAIQHRDASAIDYVIRGMLGDVTLYYGEDLSWSSAWGASRIFAELHAACKRIIIEQRLGDHLEQLRSELQNSKSAD